MKKRWPGLLLILAAVAVLLFASWQTAEVGDNLQYVTDAPALTKPADAAQKPGEAITTLQARLVSVAGEWRASVRAWTLGGVMEKATLAADDKSADGRVELLGENAFTVHPRYLLHGRLFFEEELSRGDHVMLLDEQAALALFSVADPIDRTVTFNDEAYRVVGIVRHDKRVGDYTDFGAYIPLSSVLAQTIHMDALVVEADPIPGSGAGVAFAAGVKAWRAGGTIIDLGKESMAAGLWLRVLLFAVGAAITLRYIRWLNGRVRRTFLLYRRKLRSVYAARLLLPIAGRVILFALGYALAAGAAVILMNYIVQPVYTFPEWIPAVLVEWDDVTAAFWNVWQTGATVREFRTPELMRLRFLTLLTQGGAAVAGAGCALWFGMTRARKASPEESLRIMAESGIAASWLQTADALSVAELGYVPCSVGAVRIINAQRVLELMPGGTREGTFTLAVEDALIPENNRTFCITCHPAGNTVRETNKAYEISMPIQTLTGMIYGQQPFAAYLESHADFTLRLRSPAMEGFFSHHLHAGGVADA
ncbi:MAG: ABC transporter permease [Clostridia bacterium]|nr:ABC transporter permease [Clostridia bacterium]